jgi:dihydrofolate synthase/folylpolyglutamate synthase
MVYEDACRYIEELVRFTSKHSNEHTRLCLELLGNPDRSFRSVHCAGTNGKGSTCAFLSSVFQESGQKTALFTSPHLVRINERMQINGKEISELRFAEVFDKVRAVSAEMEADGEGHPSYFEFLFLMAMVYFKEEGADVAVIETGLGGRLDATNAIEHPEAVVITAIGMDHMQYLGNTIHEIAAEKAGIIKKLVPVIYDDTDREAAEVIERTAGENGCPLYALRPGDFEITGRGDGVIDFRTSFSYDGMREYSVHSDAPYQAENAALAILTLKALAEHASPSVSHVDGRSVREGIRAMRWPGRMERIRPHVYLDGAHNDNGIRRFLEAVRSIAPSGRKVLLFAVVNDKDYADMIRDLMTAGWDEVIVSEIPGPRRTEGKRLRELFEVMGAVSVKEIPDAEEAIRTALVSRENGELFICGSLYLAGMTEHILSGKE